MKGLDGKVALVSCEAEEGYGKAIALALAARGVKIVVLGPVERMLGETVGEIAFGGGKARHVVGDPSDPACLNAAIDRARSVFGGLDLAISTPDEKSAKCTLSVDAPRRFVLKHEGSGSAEAVTLEGGVTAIHLGSASPEDVAGLMTRSA